MILFTFWELRLLDTWISLKIYQKESKVMLNLVHVWYVIIDPVME